MLKKIMKNKINGFSIIEIVLVLGISLLLIAVVVLPLVKNRQGRLLLQSTDDIVSVLNKARSNTLSSIGSEQYGVKIENDKAVLFTGATYSQGSASNKITYLQNGVEIESAMIVLNGSATSVVFDRLTGGTDNYGTITLRLKSDTSKTKTITIEKTGTVKTD